MKRLFSVILIIILSCACSPRAQNAPCVIEFSDAEIIKTIPGSPHLIRADQAKTITISGLLDMVETIDYIKLDSSEPIGVIDKMLVTKDKIFVLDAYTAQQIFVFNKAGKLLYRIKNKGRGPQEYQSIADMQVDTVRNEILVNDALALSYIYYSAIDGQFLRREKGVVNCYLARIDSLYVNYQIPRQDFNNEENWSILITDKDSILYKGFAPMPLQDTNFGVNSFSYDRDGSLLFTPVYSDTVYQFTSAAAVTPKYAICQKKSVWRHWDQNLSSEEVKNLIQKSDYTRYNARFLSGDNYASFEIAHKWNNQLAAKPYFWDKRSDAVYVWDTTLGVDKGSVIRDIIQQPIAVYGNTFLGTFSPQIPEEYRKDLNPKIKNLLDISEDSDNPIVVMYKLK